MPTYPDACAPPVAGRAESTPPPGVFHLPFLDGLRALAALFVVLHHAWLTIYSNSPWGNRPPGFWDPALSWMAWGHYAVDLFIVLSGFCLMLPVVRAGGVLRGGTGDFFRKRAWRILPPYYFALALSLVLIWALVGERTGAHWDISVPVTRTGLLSHLLLLQDFEALDAWNINHAHWSIALEWHIYFFFPALLLLWRRLGPVATTLGTFVVVYPACYLLRHERWFISFGWYLALFALGMLAAEVAFGGRSRFLSVVRRVMPWRTLALLGAAVVVFFSRRWGFDLAYRRFAILDAGVGAATAALLVHLALRPAGRSGRMRRLLEWRPLVFLGTFSYSLYLIHAPLVQIAWQYGLRPLGLSDLGTFLLLATAGTAFCVAVSWPFFLLCERPFLTRRRRAQAELVEAEVIDGTHAAAAPARAGVAEVAPVHPAAVH